MLDDVTVQYGPWEEDGGRQIVLFFSREFSEAQVDGAEPVCHVGCEFSFAAETFPEISQAEFWTQDHPSLEQFIDAVESTEAFQALVNADPLTSSVFREEV